MDIVDISIAELFFDAFKNLDDYKFKSICFTLHCRFLIFHLCRELYRKYRSRAMFEKHLIIPVDMHGQGNDLLFEENKLSLGTGFNSQCEKVIVMKRSVCGGQVRCIFLNDLKKDIL